MITFTLIYFIIIMISGCSGFYQQKVGWTNLGKNQWQVWNVWFSDFSNDKKQDWLTPFNTNGGIIGALIYGILASISSGIGAAIITCLLAISLIVIMIMFWKKHNNKSNKQNKHLDLPFVDPF